jgi:hypothetical protein
MILFLTGPTGSGKTDTSWALIQAFDDLVFLDCDWFASRSNFAWTDAADVASVYRAVRSQIDFHRSEGRNNFVVTLALEMATMFEEVVAGFVGAPIFAFRLLATLDVLAQRIDERGRPQKEQEKANAISQQRAFDRLFPDDRIFMPIDTTGLESEDVAGLIVRRVHR